DAQSSSPASSPRLNATSSASSSRRRARAAVNSRCAFWRRFPASITACIFCVRAALIAMPSFRVLGVAVGRDVLHEVALVVLDAGPEVRRLEPAGLAERALAATHLVGGVAVPLVHEAALPGAVSTHEQGPLQRDGRRAQVEPAGLDLFGVDAV